MTATPTLDDLVRFASDHAAVCERNGWLVAAERVRLLASTIQRLEITLSQLQRDRDEDRRERDVLRKAAINSRHEAFRDVIDLCSRCETAAQVAVNLSNFLPEGATL